MNIGNKIKNLRRIKNLTQEELAERTDLSKGYISQIESEHASPSMETFLNIIEVLGTTPSEFFKDSENEKVLYKKEEQVIYDEYDEGYILNWLVSKSNEYDMEPLIFIWLPSESDTFIYCMSGQITLNLGKEVYQAQEEDVLYFKARDNHRLSNESNNETRILIVATASYL